MQFLNKAKVEPYRLFFPLGILFCLWGILLWLPQIFIHESYPVLVHRYLMLNGFSAMFIAGFLMTAVPKFSQTNTAKSWEIGSVLIVTVVGLIAAYLEMPKLVFILSAAQAGFILAFIFNRVLKRKANPPYSFVFIFAGLLLWMFSGLMSSMIDSEAFKILHYEGSIAAIILGVGSRLIPGILGHSEIVQTQRSRYENEKPFFLTVPIYFYLLIIFFVGSYFIKSQAGSYVRTLIVSGVGFYYWKLTMLPKIKTSLTICIWISCWLIVLSFLLTCFWRDGQIHASHSFFLSGTLLLTLLIATRVLQSHGPKRASLENSKILYVVTFLLTLAAATRVSAYLLPEHYLRHLGYSSLVAALALIIWSAKYLRYVKT